MYRQQYFEKLSDLNLLVAFNTNIDAIKKVDTSLEKTFEQVDIDQVKKKKPRRLKSKTDLLAAIIECMEEGKGNEIKFPNDKLGGWFRDNIEPDTERMGGQAGIIANLVSSLGVNTYVYTNTLSQKQARFFRDNENIYFPSVNPDNKLIFKHPQDSYCDVETKINYIFEFDRGNKLFDTIAKSHNRFIASSDTELTNLDLGPLSNHIEKVCERLDCMILSGFQNLNRKYSDGTTWIERLDHVKKFIRNCKKLNDNLNIHIEYTTSHKEKIRKGFLKRLVPHADVLSMDENELNIVLDDLGEESLSKDIKEEMTAIKVYRALETIRKKLDMKNVKVHTLNYYMSVSKDYIEAEHVKKGFEFASDIAFTKATIGNINSPKSIEIAKEITTSQKGRDEIEKLAEHLNSNNLKKDFIHKNEEVEVVIVPNKVAKDPEYTVGLGDSVSSASFALENSLIKS